MQRLGDRLVNWASILEPRTRLQAETAALMPFIHPHIALMPDAHLGKGATVGSVIPTLRAIIPAAVGVDIGCGMIAVRTQINLADLGGLDRRQLRLAIERAVPLSAGIQRDAHRHGSTQDRPAGEQGHGRLRRRGREMAAPARHPRLRQPLHRGHRRDTERVWLFLHSGSRGIGNKLAMRHIKAAQEYVTRDGSRFPIGTLPIWSRTPTSSGPTSATSPGHRSTRCSTARR